MKRLWITCAAIIFAGGLWWSQRQRTATAPETQSTPPKKQRHQELIKDFRKPVTRTAITPEKDPCESYVQDFLALDLQDLLTNQPVTFPKKQNCTNLPEVFSQAESFVEASCKNPTSHECYGALQIMRSIAVDRDTKDLKINEIHDPVIVVQKMFAALFRDPKAALEYAERLVELEPQFVPAIKTLAKLQLVSDKPLEERQLRLQELRESSAELEGMTDSFFDKIDLSVSLSQTQGDLSKATAVFDRFVKSHPDTAESDYIQSWKAYQARDFTLAKTLVDRALEKNPGEPRWQQTQKKLASIEKGEPATEGIYAIGFELSLSEMIP